MGVSRKDLLNDEGWTEVNTINPYAVFMGYLSMAIKGLGFLVLTWTTVVLLGGFVSMLQKKDFWCLTFITLVQTAGIFDVNMNEKLGYMINALGGLLSGTFVVVLTYGAIDSGSLGALLCACFLTGVQVLMFAVLLCPLAIIYVFGIVMSGGVSLWRVIEHDYVGNMDGQTSNLEPAMDTLYYLALLQGVLFCYRFMLGRAGKRLAKVMLPVSSNDSIVQLVSNYLRETKIGCEKDPSFAKGRNLITHAIDKIGSDSPSDCILGVKILCATICIVETELDDLKEGSDDYREQQNIFCGQSMLMRHLVLCASSSRHTLQKLLETLNTRGLHDRQTRSEAAKIVERLAFNINLEEFPRGIQNILSLIGTFEQYIKAEPYQQENDQYGFPSPFLAISDDAMDGFEKEYKILLLRGLNILQRIAADEKNCKVMSDTQDLISNIMAPVTSDLVHNTSHQHDVWSDIVERSMDVMLKLTLAPGETGAKLRHEISSCEEAMNTLWRILGCNKCEELHQRAFWTLTRLYYTDTTSEISRSADFVVSKKQSTNHIKEDFVRMLVDIFTDDNSHSGPIRAYAGAALSWICFRGGISDVATTAIQSGDGNVFYGLANVLVHDENETCRQAAAEILENLCTHYTKDDELPSELKKAVTDAMQKVLGEIIRSGEKADTGKEADKDELTKPKSDIENQCDGTQENDERERDKEEKKIKADVQPTSSVTLLSSLLSLCATVYDTAFINDLPPQLDASLSLTKLQEVVVEKSERTVENLLLCKAAAKIVISMIKYRGSNFIKQEDIESFIEALSSACKRMLTLDHSMVFRSTNFSETPSNLARRTLTSLVKEIQDLNAEV